MTTLNRQNSFSSGELAPSLKGRVDIARYLTGLEKCLNAYPKKSGGVDNRAGTVFAGRPETTNLDVRLIPFIFNNEQTYALEFSGYPSIMRVVKEGAYIYNAAKTITGITQANPAVVTCTSHGFSDGDDILIEGVEGMTQVNGGLFKVFASTTHTFQLSYISGIVDSSGFDAYTTGGTAKSPYQISSPYTSTDLSELRYSQSADVLILTHDSYPMYQLSRSADDSWAFAVYEIDNLTPPTFVSGVAGRTAQTLANIAIGVNPLFTLTTNSAGSFVDGDEVYITGATGGFWDLLNHRTYIIYNKASEQQFYVKDTFGNVISTAGYGAYNTNTATIYKRVRYAVTAVDPNTGEESPPCPDKTLTITGISLANPAIVTSASHGLENGDEILIRDVVGIVSSQTAISLVNNKRFRVSGITTASTNTFALEGLNTSTGCSAYGSGGTAYREYIVVKSGGLLSTNKPNVLNWTKPSGSNDFNVYRSDVSSVYGFIGTVTSQVGSGSNIFFKDSNFIPDLTSSFPVRTFPFTNPGDYPKAVTFYQQRLVAGGSSNAPQYADASRIGSIHAFAKETPIQDDSSLRFNTPGQKANRILHLVDFFKLLTFTSGGEWIIQGDQAGSLIPGAINPRLLSSYGSGSLEPLVVGNNVVYQSRGSIIRALEGDGQDSVLPNELSIFSDHLIRGHSIVAWAYQQAPESIIWAVRDDGILLSLTYHTQHQVLGWARHETDGLVKGICCIPEGDEDAVYLVVQRDVEGTEVKYTERMSSREIDDIVDANFLDCTASYDGRGDGVETMTLTSIVVDPLWDYTQALTLTCTTATFLSTDVGNRVHLTGPDGSIVRCSIASYSDAFTVTVYPNVTVPVSMRATAITEWARAVDVVQGLWHLEGKDVAVFADGQVIANPNNPKYDALTVENGSISLPSTYGVITVGLPYLSDMKLLPLDASIGLEKGKNPTRLTMRVEQTRGLWAGNDEPEEGENTNHNLTEMVPRGTQGYDELTPLRSETIDILLTGDWSKDGSIFLRQIDPVPMSILSIVPSGYVSTK